ncbi:hypothetical protein HNP52_004160 [Sphingomonas kyeonggiensis]|uniref:Uncharacterized protein n=1 Tax=Sphingomonas kyeonggiensis TaxID=1268553 RepID=A0A7W7K5K8_9SPHN|nr:hypothetical protein [Sphingomonas kyeonggiensis]MBB4841063.1 hypothetical protein [Sphingomonas kyeonggiensis]
MRPKIMKMLGAGTALAGLLAAGLVVAQTSETAPEARYVMDIGTTAGMMGQGDSREMVLRLGSRLPATGGAPKADHFLPEGMRMGASVPLVTPEPNKPAKEEYKFERPKGRMLIYWGCGAHVGPGQPVIIDFAKVAKGQMPPDLFAAGIPAELGPRPGNSRTYGDWPNGKGNAQVRGNSSLIGQHRIAGNYSPEISFALNQDFMSAPRVKAGQAADGSIPLNWGQVPLATGYYAWAMGTGDRKDGDMVWWASSATRQFGGDLWSWLSPATVNRLIGQKVVMPATQTSCTIPTEVKAAAGEMMMGFLYAYGPEANFAFPERPKDPKIAWRPKWTAKARYRSMANFMTGMPDMGDAMRGQMPANQDGQPEQPKPKPCKPKLGGLLKRAAGLGGGC